MEVEYRDIPDFPGYRVGDDGSVWSAWAKRGLGYGRGTHHFIGNNWRLLKPQTEIKTGYLWVRLTKDNKLRVIRVHSLVLRSFRGPRPKGEMTCHKDDNPSNNRLENLYWGTQKSNSADARRNGRLPTSGKKFKITLEDVFTIRKRAAAGEDIGALAVEFGISKNHCRSVVNGRYWNRFPFAVTREERR